MANNRILLICTKCRDEDIQIDPSDLIARWKFGLAKFYPNSPYRTPSFWDIAHGDYDYEEVLNSWLTYHDHKTCFSNMGGSHIVMEYENEIF